VSRLASILTAAALAAGLAGCGGGSHPRASATTATTLPRVLAQAWAARADQIAAAAAAGRGCHAQALASSLRDDVVAADARVPAQFRITLLSSVNELADRITCTPQTKTVTTTGPPHPKPPPGHHPKPPKPGKGPGDH
jgi:hypothetical protein